MPRQTFSAVLGPANAEARNKRGYVPRASAPVRPLAERARREAVSEVASSGARSVGRSRLATAEPACALICLAVVVDISGDPALTGLR